MYANGAINITLSILSIIPPCPGNKLLKSFTSKYLFITDAEKSPIWPIMLNIKEIIPISKYEIPNPHIVFSANVYIKQDATAPNVPATQPSIDLLGLTLLNFVFPILLPNTYANTSVPHAENNTYQIRYFPEISPSVPNYYM